MYQTIICFYRKKDAEKEVDRAGLAKPECVGKTRRGRVGNDRVKYGIV